MVALVVLLVVTAPAGAAVTDDIAATTVGTDQGRTWVVDAVDDSMGSRWVSEDTGTSEVTVQVGDTVEWQFDSAVIDHDLTSQDSRSSWAPEVTEYRRPGDPPIRYTFTEPGAYEYLCSIHGTLMRGTVVVIGDEIQPLPEITATATPSSGTAPLDVAFSTEVTTAGEVAAFADGLATYPDLVGAAELVRARGESYAALEVTGLKPDADHMVHVHEQACSQANGGAHFRFDETKPFDEENEIWLPFTSDAQGHSGLVEVTQPQRAGAKAVSIVIHDPDNPAKRIGCVDLAPSTAGLAYAWEYGDGTSGEASDPDHTYNEAGTYTATVTLRSVHAGHDHAVTDSVEVIVADTTAPQTRITSGPRGTVRARRARFQLTSSEGGSTFECRLDGRVWGECSSRVTFRHLREGRHTLRVRATDGSGNTDATPDVRRWTVDTTGPSIRRTRPGGVIRDRTPTVRATVSDRHSAVLRRDLVLRVDGRIAAVRYDARRDRLSWTPRRRLSPGRHAVRLAAIDATGNRRARTWHFRIGH